jgi:hypothetical protein
MADEQSPTPAENPTPVAPLSGACMCGGVRFSISEPLLGAIYCHCKRCQRRTGTAFSINGLIQPGSFAVTEGEDLIGRYDPGDGGWRKSFCSRCGSHLFTTNPDNPELVGVRIGSLDQDPGVRPGLHQFVDYAAPWAPVPDDGLPRFPERMTWE